VANFVQNCEIYSKELLFNEINGITNSDKFCRSYECFWRHCFCTFFAYFDATNKLVK